MLIMIVCVYLRQKVFIFIYKTKLLSFPGIYFDKQQEDEDDDEGDQLIDNMHNC